MTAWLKGSIARRSFVALIFLLDSFHRQQQDSVRFEDQKRNSTDSNCNGNTSTVDCNTKKIPREPCARRLSLVNAAVSASANNMTCKQFVCGEEYIVNIQVLDVEPT